MNGRTNFKTFALDSPLVYVLAVSALFAVLYFYSFPDVGASRELGRASNLNEALETQAQELSGELAESGKSIERVTGRVQEAEREAETVSSGAGRAFGEIQEAGSKVSSAIRDAERAETLVERCRKTLQEAEKTE